MADLTQTSANVKASVTASILTGIAGATIAAGQPLYLDSGSATLKLANASTSAATATVVGLATCSAVSGQNVTYVASDTAFTHGLSGVAAGDIVILSNTDGKLTEFANVVTGMYDIILFLITSATQGKLVIVASSVTHA